MAYNNKNIPEDYKDLGWENNIQNKDEYQNCKHDKREVNNSTFINRDTDIVTICDECKVLWHTDASD